MEAERVCSRPERVEFCARLHLARLGAPLDRRDAHRMQRTCIRDGNELQRDQIDLLFDYRKSNAVQRTTD